MEVDNTLYKLRNFEFEFLQDILGKNNFGNVLEIGPGKFPINKFINVTKYLGIEKSNQNLELEIYTITDIGFYNNSLTDKLNNVYGLGGGYRFKLNNNFVDLGYVIGNNSNNQIKLDKSKLIVRWTTYF